jgi:hypothetical protein
MPFYLNVVDEEEKDLTMVVVRRCRGNNSVARFASS